MFLDDAELRSLTLFQLCSYSAAVSAALLFYDYSITVADEIELIWFAPWGAGKGLFLLNRYLSFIDTPLWLYRDLGTRHSLSVCGTLDNITGCEFLCYSAFALVLLIVAASSYPTKVIMILRVWALWARSRILGAALAVLTSGTFVGVAVAYVKYHQARTYEPPILNLGCRAVDNSRTDGVIYILVTAVEISMLILIMTRGLRGDRLRYSSAIRRAYRDGILYYVILAISSALNASMMGRAPRELATALVMPQRILHSILSARIMLRLRADAVKRKAMLLESMPFGDSIFAESCVMVRPSQTETSEWFGDPHSRCDGFVD
ncbi:hypothetical protein CCMSSC00406_0005321 [Pleurotus cornucopiae]|uniref:Uncharacterized protein n=1 Tax=Pleurotus cornucopiae TaxID=5321 RepID=A0ACB7IMI7_PLECO|nr:hypothetical protein CCMSSC00406_0005321 [Pleurotus cornucopiae]